MSITKIILLRWIIENTRKDRIRNEEICLNIEMVHIDEKIRENQLRWYGHIQNEAIRAPVKKSNLIQVNGMKRGRGRPKITLVKVVKKNMLIKEVTKNMILYRIE